MHALEKSLQLLRLNGRNNRVLCTAHHLWVYAVVTGGEGKVIALCVNIIFREFAAVKRYGDRAVAVFVPRV